MKKYENLALRISTSITGGDLAPGARLPSVRDLALQYRVSADTVYRAYYQLEGLGLIQARPRSGYFVNDALPSRPVPPTEDLAVPITGMADDGSTKAFVFSLYERLGQSGTLTFGASFPGAGLYPYASLARSLAAAARTLKPSVFTSGLSNGDGQLREQIAQRYRQRGTRVSAQEIVITSGASEALALSLQSLTAPGDTVVIEDPCFYGTLHLLQRLQLHHVAVPVIPGIGVDLDGMERALRSGKIKACVLMTSLQHPTGVSLSTDSKRALTGMLARYAVPLVEDDVYAELAFSQLPLRPALAYDQVGQTLNCGSFSKSLAPGYRIGWVAGSSRMIDRIRKLRLTSTITPSVPIQAGLSHYLARGSYDRHLRRLRRTLEQQQRVMLALIEQWFPEGCVPMPGAGGYHLWIKLPQGRSAWRVARCALDVGITVMPGNVLSGSGNFDDHLRLNYGHAWSDAAIEGIKRLGRIISNASI